MSRHQNKERIIFPLRLLCTSNYWCSLICPLCSFFSQDFCSFEISQWCCRFHIIIVKASYSISLLLNLYGQEFLEILYLTVSQIRYRCSTNYPRSLVKCSICLNMREPLMNPNLPWFKHYKFWVSIVLCKILSRWKL